MTHRLPSPIPFILALPAVLLLGLLALAPPPAWPHRVAAGAEAACLEVAGGCLEVALHPDHQQPLRLMARGPQSWAFTGATAPLVGRSYSVTLRNRTSERLKVVVGIDGLNVYARRPVAGRSDRDVGSILVPWSERLLPGWQLDDTRAERFLFSPPEWSEGQGMTAAQIGILTVEVYRERQQPATRPGQRDHRFEGARPEAQEGAPSAARESGGDPIGTSSGEEVASSVRTVSFRAASPYPDARAIIDYGQALPERGWPAPDRIGVRLEHGRGGARVAAVAPGSPAASAGLAAGDLIVRIDTVDRPSPRSVRQLLGEKRRGDYVFLRVRRGHHEIAFKVRL
jgi:hypothetical protein